MPDNPVVQHYDVRDYEEANRLMSRLERNHEWAIVEYKMRADFRYRVWANGRSLGGAHTLKEANEMIREAF